MLGFKKIKLGKCMVIHIYLKCIDLSENKFFWTQYGSLLNTVYVWKIVLADNSTGSKLASVFIKKMIFSLSDLWNTALVPSRFPSMGFPTKDPSHLFHLQDQLHNFMLLQEDSSLHGIQIKWHIYRILTFIWTGLLRNFLPKYTWDAPIRSSSQ